MESTIAKAEKIGSDAKIKEQALMDVRTALDIAGIYGEEMLERACGKGFKGFPYDHIQHADSIHKGTIKVQEE